MKHVHAIGLTARFGLIIKQGIAATILTAAVVSQVSVASPASETTQATTQSKTKWVEIDSLVTAELQQIVDKQPRIDGQSKLVNVRAKVDPAKRQLTISLSRGYVPKVNGSELEDLQSQLSSAALEIIDPALEIATIEYLYDGRPISAYFPEDAPPPSPSKQKKNRDHA
ncbi:hypothetical protein [Stenotrophomonas rhizophila]|uniref:hypothetical protein n=1 Tax=Stenotrophomonas rhizophila TaxID=216778 RepID=UPI001E63B0F7|nr:hypothetical protein [Stenotrophomonas rhizophila]MCC7635598.1 hypothetical protein [Stenotrophomonas rhizophila]MCC7665247.1 hypothetical protein [Stenotrophomonas rhizophila]